MSNLNNMQEDEIDLKEVFKTILKYKIQIILITYIFTMGAGIFAYLKPNIYTTSIVLELEEKNKSAGSANADFMMEALSGSSGSGVANEIEVMKSRLILQKSFDKLDLNTNYFANNKFKKIEYYKNSPFVVDFSFLDDFLNARNFVLTPIDENSFNLQLKKPSIYSLDSMLKALDIKSYTISDTFSYNQNHKFNELIQTEHFSLIIKKVFDLKYKTYNFSHMNNMDVFDKYKEKISVSQISKSASILNVSLEDTNPNRIKDILSSIYDTYTNEDIQRKTEEAKLTLDFIDVQLESINKRLNISATNLESFKEKNKLVELSGQAIKSTERLSEYEGQLEELKTELNVLLSLKSYVASNSNLLGMSITSVNLIDPKIATLVSKLQDETARKSTLLIDYTPAHPELVKVSQKIRNIKKNIVVTINNNIAQFKNRKQSLENIIRKYDKSINTLPKQERELSKLTRLFSVDEKIYSYLLEKKAESAILQSSTISNTRLLDEGIVSNEPVKPKRKLIVMVGFILGFILSIFYAFIREFFNNTISNSDDIEKLSSIPIYGIIPDYKGKKAKKLVDEAYRSIRTNLQFLPNHEKSNVIAITSSVSGEGKTTTSSNLAKIIAKANKSVVVLDLDLRKSSLHLDFNIPNTIGISSYLSGQNTLEEITNFVEEDNVSVLTTGSLPPNPSELILSDKMKELIDILKAKYDYVIFDTPPVGLVTDAMILINYADISFLVIKAFYTRKEFVKNLDRLSKEHKNNTFGLILNGVEIGEKYGYGYGSNYGYGYGNAKYYKDR